MGIRNPTNCLPVFSTGNSLADGDMEMPDAAGKKEVGQSYRELNPAQLKARIQSILPESQNMPCAPTFSPRGRKDDITPTTHYRQFLESDDLQLEGCGGLPSLSCCAGDIDQLRIEANLDQLSHCDECD